MTDPAPAQTIVFFDGVCHLCNAFVDFAVERDARGTLRFAALQGKTAEKILSPRERGNFDTVLVWHQGRLLDRSEAVLKVLEQLGGFWRALALAARPLPRFFRDSVYTFVAKRRYAWFGKRETCRLPTLAEKSRILD